MNGCARIWQLTDESRRVRQPQQTGGNGPEMSQWKTRIPRGLMALFGPFFTARFFKFACVGFSGIGVNLGALYLLADGLQLHANLSSALAIELSILSNFMFNEYWTFRDRRVDNGGFWKRGLRFNLVSLVGAVIQWGVFVYGNIAWAVMLFTPAELIAYHGTAVGLWDRWILHPIISPPDVGVMLYASQLLGIAAATFWNYLVNVRWTWATKTLGKNDHV